MKMKLLVHVEFQVGVISPNYITHRHLLGFFFIESLESTEETLGTDNKNLNISLSFLKTHGLVSPSHKETFHKSSKFFVFQLLIIEK